MYPPGNGKQKRTFWPLEKDPFLELWWSSRHGRTERRLSGFCLEVDGGYFLHAATGRLGKCCRPSPASASSIFRVRLDPDRGVGASAPTCCNSAAGRCHHGNSRSAELAPDSGPEQDTGRGARRIHPANRARCTVAGCHGSRAPPGSPGSQAGHIFMANDSLALIGPADIAIGSPGATARRLVNASLNDNTRRATSTRPRPAARARPKTAAPMERAVCVLQPG